MGQLKVMLLRILSRNELSLIWTCMYNSFASEDFGWLSSIEGSLVTDVLLTRLNL